MSPAPKRPMGAPDPDADQSVVFGRIRFFEALDSVKPGVAREFASAVGPSFLALTKDLDTRGIAARTYPGSGMFRGLSKRREEAESYPQSSLRDLILGRIDKETAFQERWHEWAQPLNLHRDEWVLIHLWDLLWRYQNQLDSLDKLGLPTRGGAYTIPSSDLEPPQYFPDRMTRAEYQKGVDAYVAEVEAAFHSAGWKKTPNPSSELIHLRWLARFQVAGETVKALADSEGVEPRTVERALRIMADRIGLTRRTL